MFLNNKILRGCIYVAFFIVSCVIGKAQDTLVLARSNTSSIGLSYNQFLNTQSWIDASKIIGLPVGRVAFGNNNNSITSDANLNYINSVLSTPSLSINVGNQNSPSFLFSGTTAGIWYHSGGVGLRSHGNASSLTMDNQSNLTYNASNPTLTLNSANGQGYYNNINFAGGWANGSTVLGGNNVYATIDGYGGMFFKTVPNVSTAFVKAGVGVNDNFSYVKFGNNNIGSAYSPASGSVGTFTVWNSMYNNTNFISGTNKAINTYNEWIGGLIMAGYINNTAIISEAPVATINAQYKGTDGSLNQSFYDLVFHINTNRFGTYSFHQPIERMRIRDNGNILYNGNELHDYQNTYNMTHDGFWKAYDGASGVFTRTNVLKASDATITATNPNLKFTDGTRTVNTTLSSSILNFNSNTSSFTYAFKNNNVYHGGISNIGISAKSAASDYPSYNLIDALKTGFDGSNTAFDIYIAGQKRAFFDNANTLQLGIGLNQEYISKIVLRGFDGTTGNNFEDFTLMNNGSIGARYQVKTGRKHAFEIGTTEVATIDGNGIEVNGIVDVNGGKVTGLATNSSGTDAISVDQANATYYRQVGTAQETFNTSLTANLEVCNTYTITGIATTDRIIITRTGANVNAKINVVAHRSAANTLKLCAYNTASTTQTFNETIDIEIIKRQ